MASTTMVTTPKSSSQNTLDNQKKITENEQIPNSNTATSKIDDLLKTALGGKKLNLLSPKELSELLDKVNFLDAIGLDTEGKQIPNKGNNQKSSSTSTLTSSPTSTLTSGRTSTLTSSSASTVSLPDLVGSFGTINLPTTVDFGATGSAQVIVTNQGQALASGPSTVKLYISTDGEIDSNDALLTSVSTNLNLSAGQSVTLNLTYNNNTSVIAPGAYFLIAQVDANNQIAEQLETNNVTSKLVSGLNTNAVIDWNAIALNAVQAEGKAGRGVAPTVGSRLMALVSTAVYDTVNAFNTLYPSYAVNVNAPASTSLVAAAVGAAYRVLSTQLSGQSSLFSEQLSNSLAEIQDSATAESRGFNLGILVANQSITLRANDGSNNNTPFTPPPGDY
ncbi:CARDB domain-containing protein [Microcystis aeruginosa]|uniref:CARDB domain-containing protein n=1 Tax=Microcystis aeruginosa TaxID=1126 RepID=UPI001E5A695F|nr:CARDB domain-containing protein [Microcystis aeruginosa]